MKRFLSLILSCIILIFASFTLASCKHEHFYVGRTEKDVTCEADGVKIYTCACGDSYSEIIKATGHNYLVYEKQPSCLENGYVEHTCSNCGNSYREILQATGHDMSESWIYDGDIHYKTCKNDSGEILLSDVHTFVWVTDVQPTCVADGRKHEECGVCGYVKTDSYTVISGGHKSVEDTANSDYTLCEGGKRVYSCETCGENLLEENVEGVGHNYLNGKCETCGEAQSENIFSLNSASVLQGEYASLILSVSGEVKYSHFKIEITYDAALVAVNSYEILLKNATAILEDGKIVIEYFSSVNVALSSNILKLELLTLYETEIKVSVIEIEELYKDGSVKASFFKEENGIITVVNGESEGEN